MHKAGAIRTGFVQRGDYSSQYPENIRGLVTRTIQDNDPRQLEKFFIVPPRVQFQESIHADKEEKLHAAGCLHMHLPQRGHRVRPAGKLLFNRGEAESRVVGDSELQHSTPMIEGLEDAIDLVRWSRCRNKKEAVQAQLINGLFSDSQVPQMNRVKCSPEYTEPLWHRIQPRT